MTLVIRLRIAAESTRPLPIDLKNSYAGSESNVKVANARRFHVRVVVHVPRLLLRARMGLLMWQCFRPL